MKLEGEFWVINSKDKLSGFLRFVQEQYAEHPYLVCKMQSGKRRSRSQEALWAIWVREGICPFMGWSDEQARLAMYHMFAGYEDVKVSDKLTIKGQIKRFPKDHGEAFHFLTQVQQFWQTRGLLLESDGDYADLQRDAA